MTGLAFVFGVAPMVIAAGASAKSQQALGTGVMGGMIAVVVLALLMVPVFFVVGAEALFAERQGQEDPEPVATTIVPARDCRHALGVIPELQAFRQDHAAE